MRKRLITILYCLCATLALQAQSSVWCMKTDQGQYIEMSRVVMLAAVDGQAVFEVVVRDGQGAVGVKSITFELHESDYVAPADDEPIIVTETGPWCMITDAGDSIAMSRVAMLASADGNRQFEVVATDGANLVGVNTIRFGRGKSNTSGGFKPITGEGGSTTDPNRYNPWCMITDKNDTIAMSRVQMIANVDGSHRFEIVVSDGANVTGAQYVRFAHGDSKTAGGFQKITAGQEPTTQQGDGPWCLITDRNDSIAMSRVSLLAYVDQTGLFEIVTREGEGATGVKQVRFARGLSEESGGFKPYQEGQEQPTSTTGALWLQTNKGDSQPMSNVAMLANVDGSGHFEVVLHEGGSMTDVSYVTFFREVETAIQQPKVDVNNEEPMLRLMTLVHFELKLSGCGDAANAVVYDLRGAKMAAAPVSNGTTTIAVGHLMTGVYIVRVGNKALKFFKK
ncbi:MAG: T9SS type A sorting domain-containing protein [Prevotella sp.]|nr:T9SS type A sorting domain-containing protein [Prevotella sp.]